MAPPGARAPAIGPLAVLPPPPANVCVCVCVCVCVFLKALPLLSLQIPTTYKSLL